MLLGGSRSKIAGLVPLKEGSVVLDVGSGDGEFAFAFARKPEVKQVVGLEPVRKWVFEAVEKARQKKLDGKVSFLVQKFPSRKLKGKSFDAVVFFLSLCDLLRSRKLSFEKVVKECGAVLKENGFLVFAEEFEEDLQSESDKLGVEINKALGYEYFPLAGLVGELEANGFKVLENKVFEARSELLGIEDLQRFLGDELELCRTDKTFTEKMSKIFEEFKPRVEEFGFRINPRIRAIICQKI